MIAIACQEQVDLETQDLLFGMDKNQYTSDYGIYGRLDVLLRADAVLNVDSRHNLDSKIVDSILIEDINPEFDSGFEEDINQEIDFTQDVRADLNRDFAVELDLMAEIDAMLRVDSTPEIDISFIMDVPFAVDVIPDENPSLREDIMQFVDMIPNADILPAVELCNGIDDDGDGEIDEDFYQMGLSLGGQCLMRIGGCSIVGILVCAASQVELECEIDLFLPQNELCDGLDNDCDGEIDEDFILGGECEVGIGECRAWGTVVCSEDGRNSICSAEEAEPTVELCDNLDNDCNGEIDEIFQLGTPCFSGLGGCQREGIMTCSENGITALCDAVAGPPELESCDGEDNDCNGEIDDIVGLGEECSVGVGMCAATGSWICGNGELICDAEPGIPEIEVCDQMDNNCDGMVDEEEVCSISIALFDRVLSIPDQESNATSDPNDWDCMDGDFTVEAWVYFPEWVGWDDFMIASINNRILFTIGEQDNNFDIFCGAFIGMGVVNPEWGDGPAYSGVGLYASERRYRSDWHHLACAYDLSSQSSYLFFDGSLTSHYSAQTQLVQPSPNHLKIGEASNFQIEELRISSGLRYLQSFNPSNLPYDLDELTCELWHFDEPLGSTQSVGEVLGTILSGISGAEILSP